MLLKKVFLFIIVPIIFYFMIFILVFYKIFLGDYHFINHDNFIQFYVSFVKTTLWDSNLGYGFPVYADPQWQIFYPFRYLFPKTLRGFDFYLLHFFIIGAYFTFLVCYELTKDYFSSLVSGIVFSLSGSMAAQMSMLSVPATSCFLPVIFYFFYKLLYNKEKTIIWHIGYIISLSLGILSGQPQFFIYILLFIGIYYLFYLYQFKSDKKFLIKKTIHVAISTILGFLLVSFFLFPLMEITSFSARSGKIPFDKYNDYEFLVRNIIHLFFPYFLGGIHPEQFFPYLQPENYAISHNFHEQFRYFGLLPFVFIIGLGYIHKREFRNFIIFSLIFYFLWALGTQFFLSKILYQIPIVNRLRGPSRHFLEITFIFSILTSIGLSNIQKIIKNKFKFILLFFAFLIILPLIYFFHYPFLWQKYLKVHFAILPIHLNNGLIFQYTLIFILFILFIFFKFIPETINRYKILLLFSFLLMIDLGINIQGIDAIVYASKKDIWQKAQKEKEWILSHGHLNNNLSNYRYYSTNTCVSYNIYQCSTIPFLNNINTLYDIPSGSVYNPLIGKYVGALNLLFSNKKELIPNWNIALEINNLKIKGDIFDGQILIIPPQTSYNLQIPTEIIKNLINHIPFKIKLYFSIYKQNEDIKERQYVLNISSPLLNYYQQLKYPEDINLFKDNCKEHRFVKKLANHCIYLYEVTIDYNKKNLEDIIIKVQSLLKNSIIALHSIKIDTVEKNTELMNPDLENSRNIFNGISFVVEENKNIEKMIYYLDKKIVYYKSYTPRAFFTKSIEFIKTEELLLKLALDVDFLKRLDLEKTSFIHDKNINHRIDFNLDDPEIKWLENRDYYIKLKTYNKNKGFLVLLDYYYPVWKAYIDNKEVKIYHTNIIGRGIFVPSGKHIIEFKFFPLSLYGGILISMISFLTFCFFIFYYYRKSSKQ